MIRNRISPSASAIDTAPPSSTSMDKAVASVAGGEGGTFHGDLTTAIKMDVRPTTRALFGALHQGIDPILHGVRHPSTQEACDSLPLMPKVELL